MIRAGYTRVSSLISELTQYNNINKQILMEKAKLGTFVHNKINEILEINKCTDSHLISEDAITNITQEIDASNLHIDTQYYLDGFVQLCREKTILNKDHLSVEKRYYNDQYMISGQVDLLTEYNNKIILIDWKTTSIFHELAASVQMYLYKMLVEENEMINVDACYIVQLTNYGSFNIHKIDHEKHIDIAVKILTKHAMSL